MATLLALPALAAAKGLPTVIRTGGPSAPGDAKVAIVASDKNLGGKRFEIDGAGISGKLRPAKGFSGPWKHAFAADLSQVTEPGSYRVSVAGQRSKPWIVLGEGARPALQVMLDYFATNRDGNEPALLHGPAHLNDAVLPDGRRIALQGGWMDAGDMIHFTQTTGFAATLLQLAARLDPADAAALNSEADVGVRWLAAAHPEPGLFIAQLGDSRDHDLGFRDPASDDASGEPGIGQRIAYPGIGGDVAGKVAAALALAAMRTPAGSERAALTQQARDWYAAGEAAGGPLRGLPEIAGDFYFTDSHEDDLAGAAMMLFRLTGEQVFVADAVDYLQGSASRIGFGVYDMGSLAAADLCGALFSPPVDDAAARDFGCQTLAEAASDARAIARQTAFGNPGPFSWGTTAELGSYGSAAALAGRAGLAADGLAVAAGARDYLLGRNPWGASFVTGFGPKAPKEPHHWASVFGNGLPNGAVVGGPAPLDQLTEQDFGKGQLGLREVLDEEGLLRGPPRELRQLGAGDRLHRRLDPPDRRRERPVTLTRRAVLRHAAVGSAALAVGGAVPGWARLRPPLLAEGRFETGVLAGFPGERSAILMTRVAGLERAGRLRYEIATDPGFDRVVEAGETRVRPNSDFTARETVKGLKPGERYWYRFETAVATRRSAASRRGGRSTPPSRSGSASSPARAGRRASTPPTRDSPRRTWTSSSRSATTSTS